MSILKSTGSGGTRDLTLEYLLSHGWFYKKMYENKPNWMSEEENLDKTQLFCIYYEDKPDEKYWLNIKFETIAISSVSERVKLDEYGQPVFIYETGWFEPGTGYFQGTQYICTCKPKTLLDYSKLEAIWQAENYVEREYLIKDLVYEDFVELKTKSVNTGFTR